ncbi:MAG: hypothetical protein ACPGXK_01145 [Phycisphaerae bacterium]
MTFNGDWRIAKGMLAAITLMALAGCTPMVTDDNTGDGQAMTDDDPATSGLVDDDSTGVDGSGMDADDDNADGDVMVDDGDADADDEIRPADDEDEPADAGSSAGFLGQAPDCGVRNVRALPAAGYLATTSSGSAMAGPEDSNLGKVLFGFALCDEATVGDESDETADEDMRPRDVVRIDADGNVVEECSTSFFNPDIATCREPFLDRSLALTDGCAGFVNETELPFDPEDFFPNLDFENPCGENGFVLTQDGPGVLITEDDDFICVRFEAVSFCQDCGVENGVWFEESELVFTATAEGSLNDVRRGLSGQCEFEGDTVNIRDGETVTVTISSSNEILRESSLEAFGLEEGTLDEAILPGDGFDPSILPQIPLP